MPALPEPRCFATTIADPVSRLAAQAAHTADASQRQRLLDQLQRDLREALASGRDELLPLAAASAIPPAAGLALWEALDRAINTPADPESALAARAFAIPVVFVAAGLAAAEISGVIPDEKAIARVLETHGALGPARNFGLSRALCAGASLQSVSPSRLYALLRGVESGTAETWPDLAPARIRLESADESVHLRFLVGIVVAPAQAPSFLETAGDIGNWGMPLSRELLAQLGQAGLSLLPIPRPAAGPMKALYEGRRAREEIAFQAFASRELRRLRSESGDPEAEIAALESGSIGVRLLSRFDTARTRAHRWKLDALDDLADVTASILGLLADCRVSPVRVLERVVSDAQFLGG
jgi:hypothetical protein